MNRGIECIEILETAEDPHINFGQLEEIMEFQELTYCDLARISRTPEKTIRNILRGVTKDPRISTLLPIVRALGASIDRLVGIAPKRDIQREGAVFDASLMDSMRHQVGQMQEQRASDALELDRLRKLVLAKSEALSHLEGRAADAAELTRQCADQQQRLEVKAEKIREQAETIAAQQATIQAQQKSIGNLEGITARQREELRWMKISIAALMVVIITVTGYMAWELLNPDMGVLQWR